MTRRAPLSIFLLAAILPFLSVAEVHAAAAAGQPSAFEGGAAGPAFNWFATIIFVLAVLHTFCASWFMRLAHRFEHEHRERLARSGSIKEQAEAAGSQEPVSFKAALFHFFGEIEVVFGLWILPLLAGMIWFQGWHESVRHLNGLNFTEPLFVLVIMSIAASRPILEFAQSAMAACARLGGGSIAAWWFSILTLGPILGSFITEPAAMTISALLLGAKFFSRGPAPRLAYATLGLLFVHVSIGGTLTHFAAPPVLMVAGKWDWNVAFMFEHFGWKAALSILVSNILFLLYFRRELAQLGRARSETAPSAPRPRVPRRLVAVHLLFLAWTVFTNHYPVLFLGGFLFFIGFTRATAHHQDELSLRGPLLVAFFLAGLVIHGGLQAWWIKPIIGQLGETALFWGALVLTAFNDNAAITYLASLVPGLSLGLKYAVVAGAVAGGGLTVIANAPNPAGVSILGKYFQDSVSPAGLFLGAIIPTLIAAACFLLLP